MRGTEEGDEKEPSRSEIVHHRVGCRIDREVVHRMLAVVVAVVVGGAYDSQRLSRRTLLEERLSQPSAPLGAFYIAAVSASCRQLSEAA